MNKQSGKIRLLTVWRMAIIWYVYGSSISCMDAHLLKSSFLLYLKEHSSDPITIPYFPDIILDMAAKATIGHKINDKSLVEVLKPNELFSIVYNEWQMNYRVILNAYVPNSKVNMSLGEKNINPRDVFNHKSQFENVFSQIESLKIFTDTDKLLEKYF